MPKNPNSSTKPVKREGPMNATMKFFLAGCVAELYLLVVRKYYVNGTLTQVIAWDSYLRYILWAGLAVLAIGVILSIVWNKDRKKRVIGWSVGGTGAFLAFSSWFTLGYVDAALRLMCVVVPVVMLLDILWSLYDRECAWALTILGVSLIALWVCRQELSSIYLGSFVRAIAVIYIVVLAVIAFLTHRIDQHNGKLGKLQVLPAEADPLPVYVACGLSAVAMVCALISVSAAYYAMWTLAIVVFALAVYYTVKQL